MVADPHSGTLSFAVGNPCSATWVDVPFRAEA
jgi:hypothetical protein